MTEVAVEGSYEPGDAVVIAAGSAWLLADIAPGHDAVSRLWARARDGASLRALLEQILDEGFRAVPSFAIVEYDASSRSGAVATRGAIEVEIVSATDNAPVATPSDTVPWDERALDASTASVVVRIGEQTSDVRLPLAGGVTMASAIAIEIRSSAERVARDPHPVADARVPANTLQSAAEGSDAAVADAAEDTAVSPRSSADSEPPTFDFLFGATQQRPPEAPISWTDDAPPPPGTVESDAAPVPSASSIVSSATLRPTDTMYPAPADPEPETAPPGVIDALPWDVDRGWRGPPAETESASTTPAVPAPRLAAEPLVVDDTASDSPAEPATVNRAALLAAAQSGPTVKAVRCDDGHLSPPQLERCRVCRTPVSAQNAFTAPRPVLGTIRLSTGDVVTLDRDVVLGRAPEPRSVASAADRPHVVKLASPENDISRDHLEIRLDGWHVLVVDLDSVNGTVVTLPGQQPQRLRPNQGLAIEPGTLVTLADEVSFVYEVGA